MSICKKIACAVLSTGMLLSTLAFSGCSTPAVAMTVDGKDYSSGEYLAYLYNAYTEVFYYNYYLAYYQDPWDMTLPYGEDEETAVDLSVSDYIKQSAQDTIIRQKAIENRLEEAGLEWMEDDIKQADEQIAQVNESQLLDLGISMESFERMYRAYTCNERALFYGTYDNGGSKAMTEEEIRAYFDENYLSYKIIEISLTDDDGADLSDEEKEEVMDRLEKYLNQYNTSKDFDAVIDTYEEDEAAATATSGATTTGTGSTTTGTTAATTSATTATTAATTETTETAGTGTNATGTGTTTAADSGEEGGTDTEEENTDPNRQDIDANTYGDEDFTNAIKSVGINEAKIVEYKKGGTTNTAALVLRLDPEDREDGETYFEDNRENIIYGAKYEEYNKELEEYIATLDVEINQRAVRMLDPRNFEG